jgi:hypothetical protein
MQLSNEQKAAKEAKILKLYRSVKDDPVEYINTFFYTFDPKRSPYHLPFILYPFQENLVREMVSAIENGYDIFVDKTREMGVTYTMIAVFLYYWLEVDGSNFLLGSRKESIVDNTGQNGEGEVSNKEESLFGKIDYMLNRMPSILLPAGFDKSKHRTYMSLKNPERGNVIAGESANPDFSRGGRQKAIGLDEFAFWNNDTAAWGSTADTTNCRIVVTTPGMRPNTKAKRLRHGKDGEKIKIISLPYHLDPRKDDKWLEKQRARRSEEDFAREIMINWETSTAGVVYKEARNREVGDFPYMPDEPLYQTWDFGLDGTATQWWQKNRDNGKMRLVEAISKEDLPIHWFFPLLGQPIDSMFMYDSRELEIIDHVKRFKKAIHFGDPDVKKRSMANKNLTSVAKELATIGIYVQTKPEANEFVNRRERTKILLQNGIEVNDTKGTEYWIESMDNARYPQRLDTSQAVTPVHLPIHDWTSHHRTATEYFAVNYKDAMAEIPHAYKPANMLKRKRSNL